MNNPKQILPPGQKTRPWSLSTLLGAATSVVCMGSMGAMGAAAGAAGVSGAAAGAGGMAGMAGAVATTPGHMPFVTQLLQSVGLSALTQIPDAVLRPIFILLLILGVVGAYLAYRAHRQPGPLLLTAVASVLLYVSIYVRATDPLYYLSLMLLLVGSVWSFVSTRRGAAAAPSGL